MNDEVVLMVRCEYCEQAWEIDYEPETCTCDNDAGWHLMVIPVDA
jgi:hypothetical protein